MLSEQLVLSIQAMIAERSDPRTLLVAVNEQLGIHLRAARVLGFLAPGGALEPRDKLRCGPFEWIRNGRLPAKDETLIELLRRLSRRVAFVSEPLLVDRLGSTREELHLWEEVDIFVGMVIPLLAGEERIGCIIVLRDFEYERFRQDEIDFARAVSAALVARLEVFEGKSVSPVAPQPYTNQEYERFVERGQALFLSTSREGVIRFAASRALDIFGSAPEKLIGTDIRELFQPEERSFLLERLAQGRRERRVFEEEFRATNRITGQERTVLLSFSPVLEGGQELAGWDIIGFDVSARAEAQAALELQTRKIQALYTVSAAIRGHLDPAAIGSRGLHAVLEACRADAGACFLLTGDGSGRPVLTAQKGFSEVFAERTMRSEAVLSFIRSVSEARQPVVVESPTADRRVPPMLFEVERLKSAVFVPILVENESFGVLALFHRDEARFDGGDVLLLASAAGQIGLSARQSNLFSAYRKQARSLLALYRISHELSALKSLPEVFEQAFQILRDEMGLKRVWIGMLNERGAVAGTAAFGPGWKRRLVELSVDTQDPENPISEVVKTQRPLLVTNPRDFLGRFGVERFFARFAINSLALVPLVTRGQVLGVLAAQPGAGVTIDDEELSLLSSIANEIAGLINIRRLEDKLIESERMQSTALLAAGIAHNFNNVLQAVLGQASLLDMQKMNPEQVERAARNITESATRGATVVRQLLSVANLEEARRVPLNINDFLKREHQELLRIVPPHQSLKLSLKKEIPPALVDPNHLHRILVVLVKNAVEALKTKGFLIQIFSDSVTVDGKSLHFEVPEGQYVRIGVRDNGTGMDAETKRRCFDPFFSTKNVDPGTGLGLKGEGLGLAAAYALARKNGGRLTVESRLGQGALFTLFLPVPVTKDKSEEQNDHETKSADIRTIGSGITRE